MFKGGRILKQIVDDELEKKLIKDFVKYIVDNKIKQLQ